MSKTSVCNNQSLWGEFLLLIMLYIWTRLGVSFNAYMSILVAIYSLCPKKNVILEILGQIIKKVK
jgi:hypothetical protein